MNIYDLALGEVRSNKKSPREGSIWTNDGSFLDPLEFDPCKDIAIGYALDNYNVVGIKMMIYTENWWGALTRSGEEHRFDTKSYMPSLNQLLSLYNSIKSGDMRKNLTLAGILPQCNYDPDGLGWPGVWSCSEVITGGDCAFAVNKKGKHVMIPKTEVKYIIPFYQFYFQGTI